MTDVEQLMGGAARRHGFSPIRPTMSTTAMRPRTRCAARTAASSTTPWARASPVPRRACANMLTVTKGACYICMSSSELHTLQRAFPEAGGKWSTFVIWAKNTFTLGRADYQRQYEPILYGWKEGTEHFWCGARDQGDVWLLDKPRSTTSIPTMKPVELVERAHPQFLEEPGHRARPLRRLRHDADRRRAHRPRGAADGTRSEVRRRDRPPLAGFHRQKGRSGRRVTGALTSLKDRDVKPTTRSHRVAGTAHFQATRHSPRPVRLHCPPDEGSRLEYDKCSNQLSLVRRLDV